MYLSPKEMNLLRKYQDQLAFFRHKVIKVIIKSNDYLNRSFYFTPDDDFPVVAILHKL